jgi:polysaccharide export outer membrane protein
LPAQYYAPPVDNAKTADLSRLANFSVRNELIERGDVLEVTVTAGYSKEESEPTPVRVADDGLATIPLVGRVPLAGLEPEGAEQAIAAAAVGRGVFRNPSVTVVMKHQRVNKVTVIGAVEKPGTYELPRNSSHLLAALVAAEGLSKEAGTGVEIRRPGERLLTPPSAMQNPDGTPSAGPQIAPASFEQPVTVDRPATVTKVNLASATDSNNAGYTLDDGDVVMVERRDPKPLHVIGLVNKPGQFELPANQEVHMLDALALAGGVNSQVADKIHVIRRMPGEDQPIVIEISLEEARTTGKGNVRLAAGDVVSVEQTTSTIVLGAIKDFLRFGFAASVPMF